MVEAVFIGARTKPAVEEHGEPTIVPLPFGREGMVYWLSLDVVLGLDEWLLAAG